MSTRLEREKVIALVKEKQKIEHEIPQEIIDALQLKEFSEFTFFQKEQMFFMHGKYFIILTKWIAGVKIKYNHLNCMIMDDGRFIGTEISYDTLLSKEKLNDFLNEQINSSNWEKQEY